MQIGFRISRASYRFSLCKKADKVQIIISNIEPISNISGGIKGGWMRPLARVFVVTNTYLATP